MTFLLLYLNASFIAYIILTEMHLNIPFDLLLK